MAPPAIIGEEGLAGVGNVKMGVRMREIFLDQRFFKLLDVMSKETCISYNRAVLLYNNSNLSREEAERRTGFNRLWDRDLRRVPREG